MPDIPIDFIGNLDGLRTKDFSTLEAENMIPAIDGKDRSLYNAPGMKVFVDLAGAGPYTITSSHGTHGSITPEGTFFLLSGESKSFIMAADTTYHILDVFIDDISSGALSSYDFTNIQADHTISVTFASDDTFTIVSTAGSHGTIDPLGIHAYNPGVNQTYTITPNAHYNVADVLVDTISQGSILTYDFLAIDDDHTIDATFTIQTFTITATAGANGSIDPSGVDVYNYGANQTYTMTANEGYEVEDVLVDTVSQGAVASYNFTGIDDDHTVSVTFTVSDPFAGACAIWDFATSGTVLKETLGNCGDFIVNPDFSDRYSWISDAMGDLGAISLLDLDAEYVEESGMLHITDTNLPSNFPGKVGNSVHEFSLSIFLRLQSSTSTIIMTKKDFSGSCPCSWWVSVSSTGITLTIYSQGSPPGLPYNQLSVGLNLPMNNMLHLVINYYGDSNKKAEGNAYNFETNAFIGSGLSGAGTVDLNSTDSTHFILGQSGGGPGTVKLEQVAVFPFALTIDQIAAIRAAY